MSRENADPNFFDLYGRWRKRATAAARLRWPTGHLEVCEDGSVYLGNLMWASAGTVEAWDEDRERRLYKMERSH